MVRPKVVPRRKARREIGARLVDGERGGWVVGVGVGVGFGVGATVGER